MSKQRSGFSKIELLVVVAMVFVIGGILLVLVPSVQRVGHGNSASAHIRNNLKQMALAVHTYHDVHKKLPPATAKIPSAIPGGYRSLSVHLLPYVEQLPLYMEYAKNNDVTFTSIPPFQAPLDFTTSDFLRVQNFAANVRVFTDIGVKTPFNEPVKGLNSNTGSCSTTFQDSFPDGLSNTIMFATRYANSGVITDKGNVTCSAYDALLGSNNSAFFGVEPLTGSVSATSTGGWQLAPTLAQVNCQFGVTAHSFGAGGLLVALADGSFRFIAPDMSAFTWNAAMQPNDGNKPGSDW